MSCRTGILLLSGALLALSSCDKGAQAPDPAAPGAARAELHTSRMTGNGMATMDSLPSVRVPARGSVAFAPGAQHVMLFGLPASVAPGGTLPLTLRFADGSAVRADARVIAAGDAAPE